MRSRGLSERLREGQTSSTFITLYVDSARTSTYSSVFSTDRMMAAKLTVHSKRRLRVCARSWGESGRMERDYGRKSGGGLCRFGRAVRRRHRCLLSASLLSTFCWRLKAPNLSNSATMPISMRISLTTNRAGSNHPSTGQTPNSATYPMICRRRVKMNKRGMDVDTWGEGVATFVVCGGATSCQDGRIVEGQDAEQSRDDTSVPFASARLLHRPPSGGIRIHSSMHLYLAKSRFCPLRRPLQLFRSMRSPMPLSTCARWTSCYSPTCRRNWYERRMRWWVRMLRGDLVA